MLISTFEPTPSNLYREAGITLLGLNPYELISFYGQVGAVALAGSCNILGHDMTASQSCRPAELASAKIWLTATLAARPEAHGHHQAHAVDPTASRPFFYPCWAPLTHAMLTFQANEFPNPPPATTTTTVDTVAPPTPWSTAATSVSKVLSGWIRYLGGPKAFAAEAKNWSCVLALKPIDSFDPTHLASLRSGFGTLFTPNKRHGVRSNYQVAGSSNSAMAGDSTASDLSGGGHADADEATPSKRSRMDTDGTPHTPLAPKTAKLSNPYSHLAYYEIFAIRGFYALREMAQATAITETSADWVAATEAIIFGRQEASHAMDECQTKETTTQPEDGKQAPSKNPLTVMVTGGKGVGKSTFTRTLINQMLTRYPRVAYLDTDLGQAEFGPPGSVYLHIVEHPMVGPSFTHLATPYAAHCVGTNTPRNSPDQYLAGIQHLVDVYRRQLAPAKSGDSISTTEVPLVVNTHGWINDLGYDMLESIWKMLHPDHVVLLHQVGLAASQIFQDNFEVFINQQRDNEPATSQLHIVNSPASGQGGKPFLTSYDLRILATCLYFYSQPGHALIDPHLMNSVSMPTDSDKLSAENGTPHNPNTDTTVTGARRVLGSSGQALPQPRLGLPLTHRTPYCVPWRKLHFYMPFEAVPVSQLLYALNGSIVALLKINPPSDPTQPPTTPAPSERPHVVYDYPPVTSSTCVGYAVVRSICPTARELHLLSPVSPLILNHVNALLLPSHTISEIPNSLLAHGPAARQALMAETFSSDQSEPSIAPYITTSARMGIGSGARTVRRNIMRRNLAQ
ncbi:hypothetical protein BJ085DRAFT_32735 [Dimargaris cristalligena]|uniref:Polynucleotide 5'-hydroxyl-kinase GRC3 n=1 Tax=Dimargaris cristalligena TaxID=215637 RepID=A0A4Q0A0L4_9FUNG|nr:hypothetical protein BJ085DRAFT_32735 [Dimargaris cristalligena]|eukprot:RKP39585.1 hypothetical protein BJ085DRAFT_32735 [Dimargaris cristalligena]